MCNYKAKRKGDIISHEIIHNKNKSFSCTECSFKAKRKINLKRHQVTHSNIRPFKCTNCDYKAKDKPRLNRHAKSNACYIHKQEGYLWEDLCYDIALILLNGQRFSWKPTTIIEGNIFYPEIVIYNKNGSIKTIIDAKRSMYSVKFKDLHEYPKVAEKVIFWCLHGDNKTYEKFQYVNSDTLIEELEDFENSDYLIDNIKLLQEGRIEQQPLNAKLMFFKGGN